MIKDVIKTKHLVAWIDDDGVVSINFFTHQIVIYFDDRKELKKELLALAKAL